jgi:hypothetical protein
MRAGVRDYLHVVDLALGHVAAVQKIEKIEGEVSWAFPPPPVLVLHPFPILPFGRCRRSTPFPPPPSPCSIHSLPPPSPFPSMTEGILSLGVEPAFREIDFCAVGQVVYNLGTGHGLSVIDMVTAMKKATGKDIPYIVGPRRAGDIATWYAAAAPNAETAVFSINR